jgi:hypothetical protein
MVNFFMVGSELVRWEIAALGRDVCRLMITHSNGTIVEYFRTATQALERQKEIEALFLEARVGESVRLS